VIPRFVSNFPASTQARFREAYTNKDRPIAYGERNHESVEIVQAWLYVLGYFPFNPLSVTRDDTPEAVTGNFTTDGIFLQETLEAVQEFQRVHGVKADGMVGHDTLDQFDIELSRKHHSIPI